MKKKPTKNWMTPIVGVSACALLLSTLWIWPPKEPKAEPAPKHVVVAPDYTATRAAWTKECISLLSTRSKHSQDTTINDRCLATAEKLYPRTPVEVKE